MPRSKTTPTILLLKEKYGTQAFRASNDEEIEQSSLKILQDKIENGHINNPDADPEMEEIYKPATPTFIKEQILKLPDGDVKTAAQKEFDRYQTYLDNKEYERNLWNKTQVALSTQDGKLAWNIINSRKSYEYEMFELVELQ